ncbi:ExbD/TolR family protein [Paludibacterium paludis]|uniref:Biopolymer transporter ExbD n=1 Tax=Paludibacterium paludis TaxID=1225769 RepID=A0A918NZZ9_9NEIS|nr:biopolymer transporter ExbD [Paludibacterium paludis]GGY10808.1 biopolymer transporter ExbD [Paludibacterium paludis]
MSNRHRYFEQKEARIEIVPMIDIMMFLLVFFMVVTLKMIEGAGIPMQLPGSSTAETLKPPVKVTVSVTDQGELRYEGKPTTKDALSAQLKSAKASNGKVDVIIAGDKTVDLQKLMEVFDIVRGAGITNVGIAAKKSAA